MKKIHIDAICLALAGVGVLIWSNFFSVGIPISTHAVIKMIFFSPIAEEIIFRVGIQNYLMRIQNKWMSIVLTAVLFALAHMVVKENIQSLLVFFPALLIGYHYMKYKSLKYVIILHSIYNLFLFDYRTLL